MNVPFLPVFHTFILLSRLVTVLAVFVTEDNWLPSNVIYILTESGEKLPTSMMTYLHTFGHLRLGCIVFYRPVPYGQVSFLLNLFLRVHTHIYVLPTHLCVCLPNAVCLYSCLPLPVCLFAGMSLPICLSITRRRLDTAIETPTTGLTLPCSILALHQT